MNKLDLKTLSVCMSEDDYHAHQNISHSDINKYRKEGFSCIKHLRDQSSNTTQALVDGTIIDNFITEGETFNDKYIVVKNSNVPLGIQSVFDILLSRGYKNFQSIPLDVIKSVSVEADYRVTYSAETVFKYLIPYSTQFNIQAKALNKIIISPEQYSMAVSCKEAITNNPLLNFVAYGNDKVQVYNQLKFFTTIDGTPMKFMPDIIHVDHINKIVTIYDLKSTRRVALDFPISYFEYKYYTQQWLYTELMQHILNEAGYNNYQAVWGGFLAVSKKDYSALLWNNKSLNELLHNQYVHNNLEPCWNTQGESFLNPISDAKNIYKYLQQDEEFPMWIEPLNSNDIDTYFQENKQ